MCDNAGSHIRVYNTDTMTELRNWHLPVRARLQLTVKVICGLFRPKTLAMLPKSCIFKDWGYCQNRLWTSLGLAADNQGRLLVAENGPRQQC